MTKALRLMEKLSQYIQELKSRPRAEAAESQNKSPESRKGCITALDSIFTGRNFE